MRKRPDVLEWIAKAGQDYQTAEVMAPKEKIVLFLEFHFFYQINLSRL